MRRAYTELFCHLVWATWDRLPLIRPETEPRLYGAIVAKLRELGCRPIAVNGVPDHVHCLCQFPPTVAVSYLVQQVKGASSHLMTHEIVGKGEFKWRGSYGAFTLPGRRTHRPGLRSQSETTPPLRRRSLERVGGGLATRPFRRLAPLCGARPPL